MAVSMYSSRASTCYEQEFPMNTFPESLYKIIFNIIRNKSVAEGFIAAPLLYVTGNFMNGSKIIGEPSTANDGLHQPSNFFVCCGINKTSALGVIEKAASRIEPSSLNNCKYK